MHARTMHHAPCTRRVEVAAPENTAMRMFQNKDRTGNELLDSSLPTTHQNQVTVTAHHLQCRSCTIHHSLSITSSIHHFSMIRSWSSGS
jgi:hypothetical protein